VELMSCSRNTGRRPHTELNDVHEASSVPQEANSPSYARTVLIARTNATYVIYNF